mgnify:CR=1 FL=1
MRLGGASGLGPVGDHAQKKSRRAAEQDRPELKAQRAAWRQEFAAVDPTRLVFVDESGANTAMDRTHGRAASGKRVDGPVPHGHWKVVTLTAAVRLGGVPESACLTFDGATNTACFEAYVGECLAPALRPGDIVIMDNLSCHKAAGVARLVEAAGAEVRYLPAYSPDLNPIERLFSKMKAALRKAKARTVDALIAAMGDALRAVQPGDILGWFCHGGYRTPPPSDTLNKKPLYWSYSFHSSHSLAWSARTANASASLEAGLGRKTLPPVSAQRFRFFRLAGLFGVALRVTVHGLGRSPVAGVGGVALPAEFPPDDAVPGFAGGFDGLAIEILATFASSASVNETKPCTGAAVALGVAGVTFEGAGGAMGWAAFAHCSASSNASIAFAKALASARSSRSSSSSIARTSRRGLAGGWSGGRGDNGISTPIPEGSDRVVFLALGDSPRSWRIARKKVRSASM